LGFCDASTAKSKWKDVSKTRNKYSTCEWALVTSFPGQMSMYNGVNAKTVMAYIVTVWHQGSLVFHVFLN